MLSSAFLYAPQASSGAAASRPRSASTLAAPAILFGASCGGIAGESAQTAFTRIDAGFAGLSVVRWWPGGIPNWSNIPTYFGKRALIVEVSADPRAVAAGTLDAQLSAMLSSAPKDRPIWVTLNHEADNQIHNGLYTAADQRAAQLRFGRLHRAHSPANVRNALVLMGISYIPGRQMDGHVWQDYWPADRSGIDDVGSDTYQRGTSDATADTAAKVLNPVYAVAQTLGKPVVFAELGTRHELSDAARAKFLSASIAIFRSNNTRAATYFESYRGNNGPWNLLNVSPSAATVWRNA